jgi:GNAT superfamily N-acetyltransferase
VTLYRCAQKADAPKLASLRWALRTDDSPDPEAAAKAQFIQDFVAWMNATSGDDLVHWIAEQDEELIGVISVRMIAMMPSPEALHDRFGYVTNTYVAPEHRNKGVGTALLAEVKNWAVRENLELLVVWPSDRAYPFYERSGYLRLADPVVLKLRP